MNVTCSELETYLAAYLDVARFRDYCPNGLQVEGRATVARIVTGVTASLALIERAVALKADAVLVHHGWFWRGEDPRLVGMRRARAAALLAHGVNLFGYHLPLDAHAEVGNNAQLALRLALRPEGRFGEQDIGVVGAPAQPVRLAAFAAQVGERLARTPLTIGDPDRVVKRVAWCTGAAQGMIEQAAATGADVFLTGEASEQTVHFAREAGIGFIAAGHHATERYGIAALGTHLAARFGLAHENVDIDNPV
ncbi:MAG: Nif3-like dinuclear metal center hexameric protein [Burkholderiales bacterium]